MTQPGVYEIYAHWTAHANRASNATFEVTAGGQTTVVVVDQRTNGGSYQLLGAFSLAAGDTISLSNNADGYVIADGILVVPPNAAPSTATWTFTAAETGEYQLAANWTAHPNRASNATYTLTTAAGSQTVVMDQRQSGGEWNVLGVVNLIAGETVSVALTDVADGYVIADAIQMISTTAPPNQVVWHTGLSNVGEYEVYARWTAHPNRASDASYRIQHEGGETEVTVNQQVSGSTWNYLGNFQLGPNSQVHLSDEANGYVIADAIQLVWVPPEETQALYYVHNDHLGTPQAVTDENQTVRWRARYAPFGEAEIIIDDIEMPIRFPGQYFDEESGLHHNYFRDYEPTLGRYIESDPIGLDGGMNTYGYVYQAPIQLTDWRGLRPNCTGLRGVARLACYLEEDPVAVEISNAAKVIGPVVTCSAECFVTFAQWKVGEEVAEAAAKKIAKDAAVNWAKQTAEFVGKYTVPVVAQFTYIKSAYCIVDCVTTPFCELPNEKQ